jgi:hypothetical protein
VVACCGWCLSLLIAALAAAGVVTIRTAVVGRRLALEALGQLRALLLGQQGASVTMGEDENERAHRRIGVLG